MTSRIVAVLIALAAVPPHQVDLNAQSRKAATTATSSDQPLVLAKQGSFFVNEHSIATAFPTGAGTPVRGDISGKGMYVQYQFQLPESLRHIQSLWPTGPATPAKHMRKRRTAGWVGPSTLCDVAFRSM